MSPAAHIPVMVSESIEGLRVHPGGGYVDCTLGAGGHARAILERIQPGGRLLGIDADPLALEIATTSLGEFGDSFVPAHGNFAELDSICRLHGFAANDGMLFDLGLSSMQVDTAERGFSFQRDAPLDMRFDTTQGAGADEIINSYSEQEIARILWEYGEERRSRQIAHRIVEQRPILSTLRLADIVLQVLGSRRGKIHPATRTFQALRIEVNKELEGLEEFLPQAVRALSSGGRLAVISFHSLEDRIVKNTFRDMAATCVCPKDIPYCVCHKEAVVKVLTHKAVVPSIEETRQNPRARSAKLRVAERI